jgi:hypothetical protein
MDKRMIRFSSQQGMDNENMSTRFVHESTTTVSTLQYFCSLSDDQEILSAEEANNSDHPNVLQQKELRYVNRHCLHDNFLTDNLDFDNEVIDMALEIASLIEEQHPRVRPYISMYLMKKYFGVDLNCRKFRDHIKCDSH